MGTIQTIVAKYDKIFSFVQLNSKYVHPSEISLHLIIHLSQLLSLLSFTTGNLACAKLHHRRKCRPPWAPAHSITTIDHLQDQFHSSSSITIHLGSSQSLQFGHPIAIYTHRLLFAPINAATQFIWVFTENHHHTCKSVRPWPPQAVTTPHITAASFPCRATQPLRSTPSCF